VIVEGGRCVFGGGFARPPQVLDVGRPPVRATALA
jgi:hypothetical protein